MSLVDVIMQKQNIFTYEPASQDQINEAEKELNVVFSEEYINYVSELGVAIFDGHELTGLCNGKRLDVVSVTREQRKYNDFVPNDLYVVECLDIDGIVIWQDSSGNIYQTGPGFIFKKIHDSLIDYIK